MLRTITLIKEIKDVKKLLLSWVLPERCIGMEELLPALFKYYLVSG